ncbi:Proteolipid membrane potential modulator [Dillenia turbinata]|uniref:Proteolipid membrane potential modulator n=1 Tax=Dillenia turbinata TaxID=194707 RepID=A0AAN8ZRQ9_9MAGN
MAIPRVSIVVTLTPELQPMLESLQDAVEAKREVFLNTSQKTTCIDLLLAIILPPLGVFLKFGCKIEFWICLLLTFFRWLPGIINVVWVITK